jgi:putative transposase
MHRDLSELELRPPRSRSAQQRDCDRWMVDFDEVRPHDWVNTDRPDRQRGRRAKVPLQMSAMC